MSDAAGLAAAPGRVGFEQQHMLTDCHRRRIATTVIELATDDPVLVKEVIDRLRAAGEIEADDLVYLDRIADRWIAIAASNARRGASACHARA
jgi:hypothetical protein